jgi:hypothetical protein
MNTNLFPTEQVRRLMAATAQDRKLSLQPTGGAGARATLPP